MSTAYITEARNRFHAELLDSVLHVNAGGIASNADDSSRSSRGIAAGIATRIGSSAVKDRLVGQTSGNKFEEICAEFVKATFLELGHLRPGKWDVHRIAGRNKLEIARYEQYAHLVALDEAARNDPRLAAVLQGDYTISPDIVITREPEDDSEINRPKFLVDGGSVKCASIRKSNGGLPILHASISCKWTMRSDRAQNARSEALNLIRNRKGRLPHVVVVTAEPMPSRLASIALGTGDIDCVYHFALPELVETVRELQLADAEEMLSIMTEGKRLKDISDLPLDLAV